MKINLKQKYFLVALSSLLLFLVLGFYVHDLIIRNLASPFQKREMMPPIFIAKIVDRINPSDKVKGLEELSSWQKSFPGPKLVLLNEVGQVLYPQDYKLEFDWLQIQKPLINYGFIKIASERKHDMPSPPLGGGPRFGGMFSGKPPPPPHMFENESMTLIKLDDVKSLYLLVVNDFKGPPPGMAGPKPFLPWIGLISMFVSLLLGVGVAIALIYSSVSKKVKLADDVITQLQHGNLKIRFPITRHDEFGKAMMRFNTMADEIEKLVEHLRNVEKSRSKLIQELAHDLRTPVASLKSLIETLNLKGKSLSVETHKEFLELSLKEVNYFERLVEDLLFLAQVTEPKYQMQKESVILASIIEDEAEDVAFRINQNQQKIELNLDLEEIKDEAIFGDIHLLRRLFRNALENSFSFAKSKVRISAQYDKTKSLFDIKIEDDGPGFSQESLLSFGERRVTRKLSQDINGRLSVGLGSVIMKAISDVHRGEIKVRNIISPNKEIAGSSLEVILPA